MSFKGLNAVVTGAGSGLGRSLAINLAKAGANVAIIDINESGLRETESMVNKTGVRCLVKKTDVSIWQEMESMAAEVLKSWERVDILVNNAGVCSGGTMNDIPVEAFQELINVNLMSLWH